ncbi:hypothetical protein CPAR01_03769, partial [Colletotrichum paranaense]
DAEQDEVSWCNHPPEIETSTDRWLNRRNISALPAAAMVCKFVRHRGWGRLRLKCFNMAPVNPVRTWLSPFFLLVSLAERHWSLVEMFGQKINKKSPSYRISMPTVTAMVPPIPRDLSLV